MVEPFQFPPGALVPNSRLPLLVYRAALVPDEDDPASTFETTFARHGWTKSWRNGVYPYCHYHATAHEVLGIAGGSACVRFGGDEGRDLEVGPGDVVVVPAGVAHQLVVERDRFLVVGAYAGGRDWDIVRPRESSLEAARGRIAGVPLPDADPVSGADGPLLPLWSGSAGQDA